MSTGSAHALACWCACLSVCWWCRDASPPPLVGEDGYEPKRIEEEKRWKPTSLLRGGSGEDEVERKIRKARGILNKVGETTTRDSRHSSRTRGSTWQPEESSG